MVERQTLGSENNVLFIYFLRVPLRLHLGRFTEQLTYCN